jgi:hypothetical protein
VVTLVTAGSRAIRASDAAHPSITGLDANLTVNPAATAKIAVTYPTTTVAGMPQTLRATAEDAYGNTTPDYTGTIHFTSSDAHALLPDDYTFTAVDGGARTFTAALVTAGGQSIRVVDSAEPSVAAATSIISVAPAPAASFVVKTSATSLTAGSQVYVGVTAVDQYGNRQPSYTGTVQLSSDDLFAALPIDYTFTGSDRGSHTFRVALSEAGPRTLTATDAAHADITGGSPAISVAAGPATWFVLKYPSTTTAGETHDLIVLAVDRYGNRAVGYTGTVQIQWGWGGTPPKYTFSALDRGSHVFQVSFTGAGDSQEIAVVDLSDRSIAGNVYPIQVNPAPVSQLVFDSPGPGGSEPVDSRNEWSLFAEDPYRNIVPSFHDTIHVSTTDTHASTLADHTYGSPHTDWEGGDPITFTLRTVGNQTIVASDLTNPQIKAAAGSVQVVPGTVAQCTVSNFPTTTSAGAGQSFTVVVKDQDGNIATNYTGAITFTSSDPQAILPTHYNFTAADAGVHTFHATLFTAGSQSITATCYPYWWTSGVTVTGTQANITVTPLATTHLVISPAPGASTQSTAGAETPVVVTAADRYGNAAPDFVGTIHLTASDPRAIVPPDYTFSATDAGSHTFAVTFKTDDLQSLAATDTTDTSFAASKNLWINPAAPSTLLIRGLPGKTTAGNTMVFGVLGEDPFGNTEPLVAGTVAFTGTDPQAVLPSDHAFSAKDKSTFTASLKTAGTQTIRATLTDKNGKTIEGTGPSVVVNPSGARSLALAGLPASTTAGAPQTFTVTALDAYGNIATGYLGTMHFTSSDSRAALPSDYTLTASDHGTHDFSASLITVGSRAIRASDTAHPSITGLVSGIAVAPGLATHFAITGYPTTIATGAGSDFLVTALDAYGNVSTGYSGTIHLTSDDPLALLPEDWTFSAIDAGQVRLAATFKTPGKYWLKAVDTATPSISGTETGIEVS